MLANKSGKLTRSELTAAVTAYARKHGYYVRTVRSMTSLKREAVAVYKEKHSNA